MFGHVAYFFVGGGGEDGRYTEIHRKTAVIYVASSFKRNTS